MDGSIILGGLILVSLGQLLLLRDHGSYDEGTKAREIGRGHEYLTC